MIRVCRSGLLLALCAMTGACVLFPFPVVPEKNEFDNDRVAWLQPGVTTRTEVVQRLGEPVVVRGGGSLAVYGQARTVAGWFFAGLWGSGGTMPIEKKSVFLVEFDEENTVSRAHLLSGDRNCVDDGECVEAQFTLEDTGRLMEHESRLVNAVVYRAKSDRVPAPEFARNPQSCGVYVYSSGRDEFVTVRNSTLGETAIVLRGYLYWDSEPGTVSVQAARLDEWGSVSFECAANQLRFVHIAVDGAANWRRPGISLASEADGREQVSTRSLVLH